MNKLTENSIRKAEIQEKQYKIYDGGGMFLLVHPNGSKYWRMKYTFDGKSKLASFGVWPGVSIKEARKRRKEAKIKIKMGINPVEEKRKKKILKKILRANGKNTSSKVAETENVSQLFYEMLFPDGKVIETEESIKLFKSIVFENEKSLNLSLLDKNNLNRIVSNIFNNRKDVFNIIWNFYLSIPNLNIVVLFLLLMIVMDFIPGLLVTVLYFIITVFLGVVLGLWGEKRSNKDC